MFSKFHTDICKNLTNLFLYSGLNLIEFHENTNIMHDEEMVEYKLLTSISKLLNLVNRFIVDISIKFVV